MHLTKHICWVWSKQHELSPLLSSWLWVIRCHSTWQEKQTGSTLPLICLASESSWRNTELSWTRARQDSACKLITLSVSPTLTLTMQPAYAPVYICEWFFIGQCDLHWLQQNRGIPVQVSTPETFVKSVGVSWAEHWLRIGNMIEAHANFQTMLRLLSRIGTRCQGQAESGNRTPPLSTGLCPAPPDEAAPWLSCARLQASHATAKIQGWPCSHPCPGHDRRAWCSQPGDGTWTSASVMRGKRMRCMSASTMYSGRGSEAAGEDAVLPAHRRRASRSCNSLTACMHAQHSMSQARWVRSRFADPIWFLCLAGQALAIVSTSKRLCIPWTTLQKVSALSIYDPWLVTHIGDWATYEARPHTHKMACCCCCCMCMGLVMEEDLWVVNTMLAKLVAKSWQASCTAITFSSPMHGEWWRATCRLLLSRSCIVSSPR